MVTHKDSDKDIIDKTGHEPESPNTFNVRVRRTPAIIGGIIVAGLALFGANEALKSPEERARDAIEAMIENPPQASSSNLTAVTTQPRPAVTSPDAPPATNIDRPDASVPSVTTEQNPEEALLELLATTFSDIVNARPVSPYDIALKFEDFPNPADNPVDFLKADLASYSLIMTHAYGNEEVVHALYDPEKAYGDLDELIQQTITVGRFRFPPENDPDYDVDSPNFGSYYHALGTDEVEVIVRNSGNTIVLTPFDLERINFNYDEERGGWYLTRKEIISEGIVRTYERQVVALKDDSGQIIDTEVWRLVTQGS